METTNSKIHIDHSRRSCASACLRKFYWQYIRNLAPAQGSNALRYGSTWHGFLDGFYTEVMKNGWSNPHSAFEAAFKEGKETWEKESSLQEFYSDDYRTFDNCTKAFLEYNNYYQADKEMLKVLAVEKAFSIEFPNFIFDGKLDLQIELNGVNWLMEHKTTGQYLTTQIERMNRAAQTIGYWNACRILGFDMEGILINFHQLTSRKLKSGEWGSTTIAFQRTPQLYTAQNVKDWEEHFTSVVHQIEDCLETGTWPKNYDSCYQYGRCGFLGLCDQYRGYGDENLSGYIEKKWDVKKTVSEVIYAKL